MFAYSHMLMRACTPFPSPFDESLDEESAQHKAQIIFIFSTSFTWTHCIRGKESFCVNTHTHTLTRRCASSACEWNGNVLCACHSHMSLYLHYSKICDTTFYIFRLQLHRTIELLLWIACMCRACAYGIRARQNLNTHLSFQSMSSWKLAYFFFIVLFHSGYQPEVEFVMSKKIWKPN